MLAKIYFYCRLDNNCSIDKVALYMHALHILCWRKYTAAFSPSLKYENGFMRHIIIVQALLI